MNPLPFTAPLERFPEERDLYLGADPGQSGGLAILDHKGNIVDVSPMPDTERDLSDYLREFGPRIRMAYVEAVHSMPKQGVSSSFKFGMAYGALRMAIVANDVPFQSVTPQAWQKALGATLAGRKGPTDGKTEKKNHTKGIAQQLFPKQKVTHAIADALLIAEHCRRSHTFKMKEAV